MGDYCSVQDVKNWLEGLSLGAVSNDGEIKMLIKAAMADINRDCRRAFESTTVEERQDGKGQIKIFTKYWPIISVSSVKIYNFNNQLIRTVTNEADLIIEKDTGAITLPPVTYWLMPTYGASYFYWPYSSYVGTLLRGSDYDYSNRFGKGVANILLNYVYGYAAIPEPVRLAAIKKTVMELLKKHGQTTTQGLASESIAGVALTYTQPGAGGGSGAFAYYIGQYEKDYAKFVEMWQSRPIWVV